MVSTSMLGFMPEMLKIAQPASLLAAGPPQAFIKLFSMNAEPLVVPV